MDNQATDPFILWLDQQIEKSERDMDSENRKMEPNLSYMGEVSAFERAKEKYLSLKQQ